MALGPLGIAQTVRVHPEYLRALTAHVLPSTPILLRAYDPSEEDHIAANRFLMGCVFGAGLAPTQAIVLQGFWGTPPLVEAWLGLPATVYFSLGGSIVEFSEAEKNGVRRIPNDRLLIESCPPLSPSGIEHPATPIHLGWVAHHVAQVLGQSDTFVCRLTLINGLSAFRMPVVRDHPM
jgi:Tat protein secretion system quality control protein TatD with DNase activity